MPLPGGREGGGGGGETGDPPNLGSSSETVCVCVCACTRFGIKSIMRTVLIFPPRRRTVNEQ